MATAGSPPASKPGFHTINARGSSLFRYIFEDFANGDAERYREAMHQEALQIRSLLSSAGLDYDALKSALSPSEHGRQVVFFYSWSQYPEGNYAVDFASHYLPTLRRKIQTSVLHGDLLEGPPTEALEKQLVRADHEPTDWTTQYAVYFSNLNDGDVERIHTALLPVTRYTGYIDVTFAGPVRDYLGTCLASQWLVSDRTLILDHGGDDPLIGEENPMGYDFSDKSFKVVSLIGEYYTGFFHYKIEAETHAGSVEDRILTVAAVTGVVHDVAGGNIHVPEKKLREYLLREPSKLALMTRLGLQDVSPEGLEAIIRDRLSRSYVYDLRIAIDGTPTFAIVAEFVKPDGSKTRRKLALKYDRHYDRVALVSMY